MYRDGLYKRLLVADELESTDVLTGTIFYIIMLAASIANMCFMFFLPVRLLHTYPCLRPKLTA